LPIRPAFTKLPVIDTIFCPWYNHPSMKKFKKLRKKGIL